MGVLTIRFHVVVLLNTPLRILLLLKHNFGNDGWLSSQHRTINNLAHRLHGGLYIPSCSSRRKVGGMDGERASATSYGEIGLRPRCATDADVLTGQRSAPGLWLLSLIRLPEIHLWGVNGAV